MKVTKKPLITWYYSLKSFNRKSTLLNSMKNILLTGFWKTLTLVKTMNIPVS